MGGDDGGRGSSSSSSGHLHLPSNTRKRRTVPPRLKLALVSACIAIVMLWWITPTPRNLYSPRAHARDTSEDPQARGILNTIVVPSYNEALNMEPLVSRVFQALPPDQVRQTEILVIDDNSPDSTADEIEKLRESGYNVRLHVRTKERGLSSAVLFGFSLSHGSKLLVMDADLQHPPESVPDLLAPLDEAKGKDTGATRPLFALGTRYAPGHEMDRDWPLYRRIISWGARVLSRPLTNAQDPMGGFFAIKKELYLASQPVNPSGFKIGLELLLKTPLTPSQLVHVPYDFSKRRVGASKLGMKVILKYVGQLLALYHWRYGIRFYLFVGALVGSAVWLAITLLQLLVRRYGMQETQVGRVLLSDRRKRRKQRSDV